MGVRNQWDQQRQHQLWTSSSSSHTVFRTSVLRCWKLARCRIVFPQRPGFILGPPKELNLVFYNFYNVNQKMHTHRYNYSNILIHQLLYVSVTECHLQGVHKDKGSQLCINYQLWCTDYYLFIKYYSPLNVSSLKCSSSGGYSCTHAAYGTVTLYESSWWPVGTQLEWELTVGGRLLIGRLKTPYQQPSPYSQFSL